MKTKRTEITIETARVIVVSKPKRMIAECVECRKKVDWIAVDEAAVFTGKSSRDVFQMVKGGEFHSTETREGILMVCASSLIRATPGGDRQNSQPGEPEC